MTVQTKHNRKYPKRSKHYGKRFSAGTKKKNVYFKKQSFAREKGYITKILLIKPNIYLNEIKLSGYNAPIFKNDVKKLAEMMKKGVKFDTPVLMYENKDIIRHDGRHRVLAAKSIGAKKVYVSIVINEELDINDIIKRLKG